MSTVFRPTTMLFVSSTFNTLDANTPEAETARLNANKPASRKPRTTHDGLMVSGLLQAELNELMSHLGN